MIFIQRNLSPTFCFWFSNEPIWKATLHFPLVPLDFLLAFFCLECSLSRRFQSRFLFSSPPLQSTGPTKTSTSILYLYSSLNAGAKFEDALETETGRRNLVAFDASLRSFEFYSPSNSHSQRDVSPLSTFYLYCLLAHHLLSTWQIHTFLSFSIPCLSDTWKFTSQFSSFQIAFMNSRGFIVSGGTVIILHMSTDLGLV